MSGVIDEKEMPLLAHLAELRDRLLRAVVAVFAVFLALFYFANQIYAVVAKPLMAALPQNSSMIATDVAAPFFAPFKLTLVVSFFLALPYVLYQIWAFIAPGLYRNEKRFAIPVLVSSVALFYVGVAFCYYLVFPVIFGFFATAAPVGVQVMTDISRYLDFVLTMFMAFGFVFEIPIATVLLAWSGIVSVKAMVESRRYIIVGCFVVGMILSPPEVLSQIMISLPMWILFELGVLCARLGPGAKAETDDETAAASDETKI
ncbi:MAG: twin-arginine translocase subunit TatC [Gammaproteobacteria bacterium]|nr:twin-arginine translocase subunit TatC [Gammaproteobacteria bacterium]